MYPAQILDWFLFIGINVIVILLEAPLPLSSYGLIHHIVATLSCGKGLIHGRGLGLLLLETSGTSLLVPAKWVPPHVDHSLPQRIRF